MWFAFAWMATCVVVFAVAAVAPLFAATKDSDEANAQNAQFRRTDGE